MFDLIGLFIFAFVGLFAFGCVMMTLIYLIDKFLFKYKITNWICGKTDGKEVIKVYERKPIKEIKEKVKFKKITPIKERKSRIQSNESNLTKKEMDMLNEIITDFRDKINDLIENQNLIIEKLK